MIGTDDKKGELGNFVLSARRDYDDNDDNLNCYRYDNDKKLFLFVNNIKRKDHIAYFVVNIVHISF